MDSQFFDFIRRSDYGNEGFIEQNDAGRKSGPLLRPGIFIGYRYYDKTGAAPLFPFGHGLSYTSFEYSGLRLDKTKMKDTEDLKVSVTVKNTGARAGKEIVQLYVRDKAAGVIRPIKELKGFEKVALEAGEEKQLGFTLEKRAFAFYDTDINDWRVESGDFEILAGKSSAEIVLSASVHVTSTAIVKKRYTLDSTIADIKDEPAAAMLVQMTAQSAGSGSELGMDTDALLSSIKLRSLVPMSQMQSGGKGGCNEALKIGIFFTKNWNSVPPNLH